MAGSSGPRSLTGCRQGVGLGCRLVSRPHRGRLPLRVRSRAAGQPQVLAARWSEASLCLLPLAPSTGQLTTSQPAPIRTRKKGPGGNNGPFVTSPQRGTHHVCPVLLIRSEPLGSAHTQGEAVTGVTTRGRRSLQAISGAAAQSVLWPPVIHSPPPCKIHGPLPRSLQVSSHFIISSSSGISSHQAQGWRKLLEDTCLHGAPGVAFLSVDEHVKLKRRLTSPRAPDT